MTLDVKYVTEAETGALGDTAAPVFWANKNDGIRYVRCELPARAIGGHVRYLDESVRDGSFDRFVGPHVFQLPVNRYRLDRMIEAKTAGCLVAAEFDDDYTRWDPVREASGWVNKEVDAKDEFVPSVEVARLAARMADVTIVSTPRLAQSYGRVGGRTSVCRNTVDPADWPDPQRDEDAPFRVLFAAAYNQHDFAQVRRSLEWVAAQPNAEAIVVGGHIDWPGVIHIPWVDSDLEAVRAFMTALAPDVGLRPLEKTRFAMGKSDLKVLEYALCGALPIVAPYEPYRPMWDGLVRYAKSGDEFLEQVKWAYENRGEVNELAGELRDQVVRTRGPECAAHDWSTALRLPSSP